MQPVRTVLCPRCGAPALFSPQNPWRPFCSERCKLIDLGAWASESYRVPAATPPDSQPDEAEKE
ncbi:MAG: DNA gyrase inhibitor YacG [Betaproteobacteria bacterium]|nr:MAG: DNA gyrase inhibitor YacG [Betaproteobacteria bacterium]